MIRFLSLNRDCDPKYELVLEILRKGAGSDRIPWHEKGCIIFSQYYDSAYYVAESLSKDIGNMEIGLYAGGDKSGYFLDGTFRKVLEEMRKEIGDIEVLCCKDLTREIAIRCLKYVRVDCIGNIELIYNRTVIT